MKLEDLKRKGAEAKAQEEAAAREREVAEQRAVLERQEEDKLHQEREIQETLERLRGERDRIAVFSQTMRTLAERVAAAEEKGKGAKNQLVALYTKIEETLRDEDIQKGFADLGKSIKDAEAFVADHDFSDDDDVVAAHESQKMIDEITSELATLENDEWQLHAEIRAAVGADMDIGRSLPLSEMRQESSQLLEVRINELDLEIRRMEWQTPEGKEKAESQLEEILSKKHQEFFGDAGRYYDARMVLRQMFDDSSHSLVTEEALQFKDIVGEEKFMEIVRGGYRTAMDELGEKYKELTIGREEHREFKMIERYPEEIKEAHRALSDMSRERNELSKSLGEFFTSDEGRASFMSMVRFDRTCDAIKSFERWDKENWRASHEQRLQEANKFEQSVALEMQRLVELIDNDPQYKRLSAVSAAKGALHTFDAVAKRFEFNEGWKNSKEKEPYNPTSLPGKFSGVLQVANNRLGEVTQSGYYEKLPDITMVQNGIAEAKAFYGKLAELMKSPEKLQEMYAVSKLINDYNGESNYRSSFAVGRGRSEFNEGDYIEVSRRIDWQAIGNKIMDDGSGNDQRKYREEYEQRKGLVAAMVELMPSQQIAGPDQEISTIKGDEKVAAYLKDSEKASHLRSPSSADRQSVEKKINSRKLAVSQYAAAEKLVSQVEELADPRAELDVARVEQVAFEQSSDFIAGKNYEAIERKKKFAENAMATVMKIEMQIRDDLDSKIHFNRRDGSFLDEDSQQFGKAVEELDQEIRGNNSVLNGTERNEPRGIDLWGGKRKTWEKQVAELRAKGEQLQKKREKAHHDWVARHNIRKALEEARDLLRKMAEVFPDDFNNMEFAPTLGELSKTMRTSLERFSQLKASEEETEAGKKYQAVENHTHQAQERFKLEREKILRETRLVNVYF